MLKDNDIYIGNIYDKYSSKNPFARIIFDNFLKNVIELIKMTDCRDIHELGCGEGHLSAIISEIPGIEIKGSKRPAGV